MQFTVDNLAFGDGYNATAEAEEANGYPLVRTMTVGQGFTSSTPSLQLGSPPVLPWSVANASTIGAGNWSATSAACWYVVVANWLEFFKSGVVQLHPLSL